MASHHQDKRFYKKYLKLLSFSTKKPQLTKELLKLAPLPVLKLICNAAILASRGSNINLTNKQRQLFKNKHSLFSLLGNRSIGFGRKRKYLIQKGNAAFIPILLSTVIPLVADLLFKAIDRK